MDRIQQIVTELTTKIITKEEAIHALERLRVCSGDFKVFYLAGLWQRQLISEWEWDNNEKWNWLR